MQKNEPFKLQAVIFDMDGTLLDTESLGSESWVHAGVDTGVDVPQEVVNSMVGRTLPDIHAIVADALPQADVDHLVERANFHYHRLTEASPPPHKEGVQPLLDWLQEQRIPMAVATSSRAHQAASKLGRSGIRDYFSVVLAGDEVSQGKPHPEIFQRTAELLGVDISTCAIFEDSGPGVQAAHAAGGRVIWVPEHRALHPIAEELSDDILDSLEHAQALITTWP